jgi:hypothetical protein
VEGVERVMLWPGCGGDVRRVRGRRTAHHWFVVCLAPLALAAPLAREADGEVLAAYDHDAYAVSGGFSQQCSSTEDYGWPRFASLTELQADESWATYYTEVYGALPTSYPVCVFDLWYLHERPFSAAGLAQRYAVKTDLSALQVGDLFDTGSALQIFHDSWTAAPNGSWIEVGHTVVPSEVFYRQRTRDFATTLALMDPGSMLGRPALRLVGLPPTWLRHLGQRGAHGRLSCRPHRRARLLCRELLVADQPLAVAAV